jgi:hypothetical protein
MHLIVPCDSGACKSAALSMETDEKGGGFHL